MGESGEPLARRLAAGLLDIGAVSLSPERPYVWASGLRSPIYCDNRVTLAYPVLRRSIRDGFARVLDEEHVHPGAVAGTATAGIPHAAWLAELLDLPMAYVRGKPKEHGRSNQIEGRLTAGQDVVVVEDLVSTGSSSIQVVEALRAANVRVALVLAIFSYGLPVAEEMFRAAAVPLRCLTTFETLVSVAEEQQRLAPEMIASLRDWRVDPQAWSDRHVAGR